MYKIYDPIMLYEFYFFQVDKNWYFDDFGGVEGEEEADEEVDILPVGLPSSLNCCRLARSVSPCVIPPDSSTLSSFSLALSTIS